MNAGGFIATKGELDHAIGRALYLGLLHRLRCSGHRFARLLALIGFPFLAVAFGTLGTDCYGVLPLPWIVWTGIEMVVTLLVVRSARNVVKEDEGVIRIDPLMLSRVVTRRLSLLAFVPVALFLCAIGAVIIGWWVISAMVLEMVALYAATMTSGVKRKRKEPLRARAKVRLQGLMPRMPQRIPIPVPLRV